MKLVFFFILVLIPFSWQQKGSLNLNAKLGPEYQLDSSVYTKQGSKLIKKISSLVNTPSFIINNEDLPQNGDNIKYTETDTHVTPLPLSSIFPSPSLFSPFSESYKPSFFFSFCFLKLIFRLFI